MSRLAKLDRLARSLPDARDIVDEMAAGKVKLNIGGSVHDPTDPVGRLLFNVPAMIAEFEADLARMRTREGMAVAKAKGRLRGKPPKLKPKQEAHLVDLWRAGSLDSAVDGGAGDAEHLGELGGGVPAGAPQVDEGG